MGGPGQGAGRFGPAAATQGTAKLYDRSWWTLLSYDNSKPRPRLDRQLLKRILTYAWPHRWSVLIVLVTIVFIALLDLIPPLLYRDLIDNVLPQKNGTRLNMVALAMIAIPVASGGISVIQRFYSAKAGEGIIYDLRQQMYDHLQKMSLRFFTHTKSGEIISRFNSDVVGAQGAITGTIPNIVTNIVILVSTLAVMLTIEWRLTLLSVAVVPLFILPAKRVAGVLRDIRRTAMEQNAEMSNIVNETLTINGALLVKTFGTAQRESDHFRATNAAVAEIGRRRAQVGQWFFMAMGISGAIGTAVVYWAGGWMVLNDTITTGTIVAFVAYLFRLYGPISSLSNIQVEFAQSMVSFERVFEYLDKAVEIEEKDDAVVLEDVRGEVTFEHVTFAYGEAGAKAIMPGAEDDAAEAEVSGELAGAVVPASAQQPAQMAPEDEGFEEEDLDEEAAQPSSAMARLWAVEDVSFTVEPGQLVALVGPSGAGKTTMTYLLPRLYDPTGGRILIDGHELRDVTLESLAKQIGVVTQETYLFHDTVRANLMYARPEASEEEMEDACRAAYIHDRIMEYPEGYDTIVGERGYRMSGGEKQRLAIARVILKDPRILVLDEATSHLDSQSEAWIQAALEPLMQGRTSIVIAHRLSTVQAADMVLVMNRGRLVEQGTHAELLALGGLYARLYETQFRREPEPLPTA
jgi:ATP-binding cassette subfamily B protein